MQNKREIEGHKTTYLLVFLASVFTFLLIGCQTTENSFASLSGVFISGYQTNGVTKFRNAGYWKDQKWIPLVESGSMFNSEAFGISVSGTVVVAVGYSLAVGPAIGITNHAKVPGYWRNGKWYDLPKISEDGDGEAWAIARDGNDMFISGYCFDPKNGATRACFWKNGILKTLSPLNDRYDSRANSIAEFQKSVFVSGYSVAGVSDVKVAGLWKDGQWSALPAFGSDNNSFAGNIRIIGNDIYVVGSRVEDYGRRFAGIWKNGIWSSFDLPSDASGAIGISVSGSSDTIVVSAFLDGLGAGYWKNKVWHGLAPDAAGNFAVVNGIALDGGDVFVVGGNVDNQTRASEAGFWKNDKWSRLPTGEGVVDSFAHEVLVAGNDQ